jgi:hypothetical protein
VRDLNLKPNETELGLELVLSQVKN